jgi:hypothetical protein
VLHSNNVKLNGNDIHTLLHQVKQKGDSPNQSKLIELTAQWNQRKNRVDNFLPTPVADPPLFDVPTVARALVPVPHGIFGENTVGAMIGGNP